MRPPQRDFRRAADGRFSGGYGNLFHRPADPRLDDHRKRNPCRRHGSERGFGDTGYDLRECNLERAQSGSSGSGESRSPALATTRPSLVSGHRILAGNIFNNSTYLYSVDTDSWTQAATKVYNDRSDEEGWADLAGGGILTYDLFQSVAAGQGYAEVYDQKQNVWTAISPADGTASGTLPVLTSPALGFELGPSMRLQDGRALVIGANQHTALYNPKNNSWAAGPDIHGTLSNPFGTVRHANFGADDAPAALHAERACFAGGRCRSESDQPEWRYGDRLGRDQQYPFDGWPAGHPGRFPRLTEPRT